MWADADEAHAELQLVRLALIVAGIGLLCLCLIYGSTTVNRQRSLDVCPTQQTDYGHGEAVPCYELSPAEREAYERQLSTCKAAAADHYEEGCHR